MARVLGMTCPTIVKLHQLENPELNLGNRFVAHKTARERIGAKWPAPSRYSSGQARFCANEWKPRDIGDPAKVTISEGRSILLEADTLDAVAGFLGPLKNDLDQPEQEKIGYKFPKHCSDLG